MVLEWMWIIAGVFSIVALLCGAYWVLTDTEPFVRLLGKKSAAPISLSPREVRLIANFTKHALDEHIASGDSQMDIQHQRLSENARQLRAAILSGRPADEVSAIVDAVIRDMVQHFRDEEAILAAANYPETVKHAAQHRELVDIATAQAAHVRAGKLSIGEFFQFLAHDVLVKHTLGADRDFTR